MPVNSGKLQLSEHQMGTKFAALGQSFGPVVHKLNLIPRFTK